MAQPVVIDANVFKSYYEVFVNGSASCLTGCPTKIFDNLGATKKYIAYIDNAGIIKQEWENLVDPQWFEVWYADKLILAHLDFVAPCKDASLGSKLSAEGFPRKGRDWTYIWVSRQIANQQQCTLVTEDLDFYDPPKKGCPAKTRTKILLSSSGKVAKALRSHCVDVKCVATA